MTTNSYQGQKIQIYTGINGTLSTDSRIFFASDGSGGLTVNRPYWRDTPISTPVDLTIGTTGATGAMGHTGAQGITGATGAPGTLSNYTYRSVATTQTLLSTDEYVGTNQVAGITLTFPQISSFTDNKKIYVIKDESGNASTNNILINTTGGDTIDGGATALINTNYQSLSFYSDLNTNWSIF